MFDSLNVGKLGITLNLKHPEGDGIARELIGIADAVAENFAPRAMRGFGLDYAILAAEKPEPRDGELVPPGPDRPAPRLPGFRRPGIGARRLQHPDRLARPRADRAVRDDHRLARAALRRHALSPRASSTTAAPAKASTST